jgi:D-alanyl-D-alanine carboxypeptidase (penicillin-binding protein 5/6)
MKNFMKLSAFKKNERIDIFFIYGLAVCSIIFSSLLHHFVIYTKNTIQTRTVVENSAVQNGLVFNAQAFERVRISGKAYIVYDVLDATIISAHNETVSLPLASITKVMTAVSAMLHTQGDKKVTISSRDIEDGYDLGLRDKQIWNLKELLKYTLIFSSNDGALAVADSSGGKDVFINQMNSDAEVLGLGLRFTDPAGRDIAGNIGGKGTALDTARLFSIARRTIPEILDATTKKRQTFMAGSSKVTGIPNTNQEIENLSGAEGSKTGFTDLAGGNLGVIVDVAVGHPVIIVVLGSTKQERFKDVDILYQALRNSLVSNEQTEIKK